MPNWPENVIGTRTLVRSRPGTVLVVDPARAETGAVSVRAPSQVFRGAYLSRSQHRCSKASPRLTAGTCALGCRTIGSRLRGGPGSEWRQWRGKARHRAPTTVRFAFQLNVASVESVCGFESSDVRLQRYGSESEQSASSCPIFGQSLEWLTCHMRCLQ